MLASFEIENFRCIRHACVELDAQGTGIVGPNASGKTSFLEAVYFLAHGRSFRSNVRSRLIGPPHATCRLISTLDLDRRRVVAGAEFGDAGMRVRVAGREESSISAVAELLPVQIIDPGVHRLVEEGSARRRRLLDWGVFHVEHGLLPVWRRYQRALAQRNAALRSGSSPSSLHSWDVELTSSATSIDAMRASYAGTLRPVFTRIAEDLLGVTADVAYQRGWMADMTLAEALKASTERDARLRTTNVGPHRADLVLRVEGVLARDRVSRGQQKMMAAALVLAQILAGADRMSQPTVLLLDDPAAELDVDNLGKLLEVIATVPAQLIVTSLSEQGLRGMRIGKRFHVEQGCFTPVL